METLETRLNEVARIAVRLEQKTGCPAQLMIAQWAIESAWGEKPVGHANFPWGLHRAKLLIVCRAAVFGGHSNALATPC
jgi:hypothetical protein